MPTPSSKCLTTIQDDVASTISDGDDDVLENTKPVLISFTLSNSSSSYTNGSAFSNPSDHSSKETDENDDLKMNNSSIVHHVTSVPPTPTVPSEHIAGEEESKIPKEDTPQTLTPDYSYPELQDIEYYDNSSVEDIGLGADNKFSSTSTPKSKGNAEKVTTIRSQSLHDLYQVPGSFSSRRSLMKTPSQSLLNVSTYSKSAHVLNRSSSSLSLKGKLQNYEHVQSKVKYYIQHLKVREKTMSFEEGTGSAISNMEECSESPTNLEAQDSLKLLEEIRELRKDIQQRDEQLCEVHANYQALLLQHADIKNKLDRTRFSSHGVVEKKDIGIQVSTNTVPGNIAELLKVLGSASEDASSSRKSSEGPGEASLKASLDWPQAAADQPALHQDGAFIKVSSWCSSLPPASARELPRSRSRSASGVSSGHSSGVSGCPPTPAPLRVEVCECWGGVEGPCSPVPLALPALSPSSLGVPPLNLSSVRSSEGEQEKGRSTRRPQGPPLAHGPCEGPLHTPTTYKSIHVPCPARADTQQYGVLAAHVPRPPACPLCAPCHCVVYPASKEDSLAPPLCPEGAGTGPGDMQPLLRRVVAYALQLRQQSEVMHRSLVAALQPGSCT